MTLLVRPARLVLAVSGGSDSTGLLIAFADELRTFPDERVDIVVATIDHGLRPESAGEADGVCRLCRELGLRHVIRRWDGDKPKSGVSAAAREARYRLLMEIADKVGADAIVTGHTADDQAETVMMRASRNPSADNRGLSGMAEAVLIDGRRWLLRPFLSTSRDSIRLMLSEKGRGWIDDPSNEDRHYERVRTRQALSGRPKSAAPSVVAMRDAAERGPEAPVAQARGAVAREGGRPATGQVAGQQVENASGFVGRDAMQRRACLSDAAADLARRHLTIRHGVLARLDVAGLNTGLDAGINADPQARHYLLSVLAAILGGQPHLMAAASAARVSAFVDAGLPGRITAGRVIFDRRRDGLFVQRENRDLPVLTVAAGETALWDGRYRLCNHGEAAVSVVPGVVERAVAVAEFPDVPPAIAMRAMAAMPSFAAGAEHMSVKPVLQPFDRFLPQFDLKLAGVLAEMIGCDVFTPSPIKLSARKS
ncbi:MAG: tRNA lysidine(34) synthetase TilS [Neorhizobium sp.]|nr:tRNA lysidine(34) synthetase TilS [Neorhizobium sp.]